MSSQDPSAPVPPSSHPPAPAVRSSGLRRDSVTVALGVALLAGAVVVSATRARSGSGLDVSTYLVGVLATAALLGFGLLARVRSSDTDTARTLASWPLAFGAVGVGLMTGVGLDDGTSTSYVAGFAVLVVAVGGYVATPSAPPVVAGVLGLLLVYGQAFTDVADFDLAEDNGFKTFAVAVLLFVVLATAAGWALPSARTVVPVVVGAGAVLAYTGIMAAIALTAAFAGFASFGEEQVPETPSYDGDVYLTFALAAVLVAGWLVLGYLTDAAGYRVIVVAMVATVFPAGIALLAVEHPTTWGAAVGVLGALVLTVVATRPSTRRAFTEN